MTITALPFDTTPTPAPTPAPAIVTGLGARIRSARTAAGYVKQVDLLSALQAFGLDITQSTLSAWECDKVCPRLQDIVLIADLCNVSLDYLAGLIDQPTLERGVFVSETDAALLDALRAHFTPTLTEEQIAALDLVEKIKSAN